MEELYKCFFFHDWTPPVKGPALYETYTLKVKKTTNTDRKDMERGAQQKEMDTQRRVK